MEKEKNTRDAALALGMLLKSHKAEDVVILDLTGSSPWTDYFVIATVTSSAHSAGLRKHVQEALPSLSLEIRRTSHKIPDGDDWALIDLGDVVIHLMTTKARKFYDLEKLWFDAPNIFPAKE